MRISSKEQRVKAIEHARISCERRQRISDGTIYKLFGVGDLVKRMLSVGVLTPTNLPKVYEFDQSVTSEEVESMLYKRASSIHAVPEEPQSSAQRGNIGSTAVLAVSACAMYGIEKQDEFVRDVLIGKITINKIP